LQIEGVELHNFALADTAGAASISKSTNNSSLNWRLSSSSQQQGSQLIQSKRLSDFMTNKDYYIKLDVEGAEELVMKDLFYSGKMDLVKEMIIEFHPSILGYAPGTFVQQLQRQKYVCTLKADQLHESATEVMINVIKV
jgi:hypothetical protein